MDRLVPHSPPPSPSLNPQSIPFLLKLIVSIIFPWTDLFLTHRIMTSRVTGITTKVREFTDLRYKTFFLLRSSIDWVRDLAPSTIERGFIGGVRDFMDKKITDFIDERIVVCEILL
ncbi:hypothetical protein DY000_02020520 [Brassica cretica]|uniref:Uncharacterized protein n=1 Tax=Brassica cretica TaxID=69181 RepID=A0ABQ7E2U2_BRACR|nr:hypothetical protein DY000_02020520 [Brassica cretica]